jgi:hypothetical protein
MAITNVGRIISRRRSVTLFIIGTILIIWGMFLLSFVFIYKGVF